MKRLTKRTLTSLPAAERWVKRNSSLTPAGWAARWDGWDIVTFVPSPGGEFDKRGSYDRSLGWGYAYTWRPNRHGQWNVKVPVEVN